MGYKVGVDKNQISFLPVCLDDFVGENHICRLINAFTELLLWRNWATNTACAKRLAVRRIALK